MALQVKRPTILVADLERALQLYRDVFGFTICFIKQSREDTPAYEYFNIDKSKNIITQFATLSIGEQIRSFGLIEVKGEPIQRASVRTSSIVIQVADCDTLYNVLVGNGYKVFAPEPPMATPEGKMYTEMSFLDADDNLIVLYHLRQSN